MRTLCMLLPFDTILSLVIGCQDNEAAAELEGMKARAGLEERNKELMRQYYIELDDTDIGELGEFVANCVRSRDAKDAAALQFGKEGLHRSSPDHWKGTELPAPVPRG